MLHYPVTKEVMLSVIVLCVLCIYNFSKVAEFLELKDTDLDLTSAVVLDYYVGALWWCKEQSFTAEQTSAFITVIDTLFRNLGIRLFSVFISVFSIHYS